MIRSEKYPIIRSKSQNKVYRRARTRRKKKGLQKCHHKSRPDSLALPNTLHSRKQRTRKQIRKEKKNGRGV